MQSSKATHLTPERPNRVATPALTFSPAASLIRAQPELSSRNINANSIAEILDKISHIKPGALFVFDLDNTIMEPVQQIGSDQWFEQHLISTTQIHGEHKKHVAFSETIEVYNYVQNNTDVKSVEEATAELIEELHCKHTVIALTTRGRELIDATLRQLKSIEVSFNYADQVRNQEVDLSTIGHKSHATQGVIFAGGRDKGNCLIKYLEALGYNKNTFSQIVFIDDKQRNVDQVAKAAITLGTEYLGIRYGHLDHKIEQVDLELARIQLEEHKTTGKFPKDEEAKGILALKRQQGAKSPKLGLRN